MTAILIFIHTIACILLVIAILMQSGKGGGLTEGFASAESMLGAQTNTFMTKLTTVFAVLFFVTSLALTFLSTKRDASLMEDVTYSAPATEESLPMLDSSTTETESMQGAFDEMTDSAKEVVETIEKTVTESVETITEETTTVTTNESMSLESETEKDLSESQQ